MDPPRFFIKGRIWFEFLSFYNFPKKGREVLNQKGEVEQMGDLF